jgi:hypothetical protein
LIYGKGIVEVAAASDIEGSFRQGENEKKVDENMQYLLLLGSVSYHVMGAKYNHRDSASALHHRKQTFAWPVLRNGAPGRTSFLN